MSRETGPSAFEHNTSEEEFSSQKKKKEKLAAIRAAALMGIAAISVGKAVEETNKRIQSKEALESLSEIEISKVEDKNPKERMEQATSNFEISPLERSYYPDLPPDAEWTSKSPRVLSHAFVTENGNHMAKIVVELDNVAYVIKEQVKIGGRIEDNLSQIHSSDRGVQTYGRILIEDGPNSLQLNIIPTTKGLVVQRHGGLSGDHNYFLAKPEK